MHTFGSKSVRMYNRNRSGCTKFFGRSQDLGDRCDLGPGVGTRAQSTLKYWPARVRAHPAGARVFKASAKNELTLDIFALRIDFETLFSSAFFIFAYIFSTRR